jgi:hypothetical protein
MRYKYCHAIAGVVSDLNYYALVKVVIWLLVAILLPAYPEGKQGRARA